MSEKKMGPREAELRAMREARVEKTEKRLKENKARIDTLTKFKAKGIGKVLSLKGGKRGGRGT